MIDTEKKRICKELAKATMLRVGVSALMHEKSQLILISILSFHVKDKFPVELCEKIIVADVMINVKINKSKIFREIF